MILIPRRFGGVKKDWPVYERAEADASDDPRVRGYAEDWRRAVAGQYVLTDDGLVAQIVRRQAVKRTNARYVAYEVTTPVGKVWLKLEQRTGRVAAKTELLGRPTVERYQATGNVTDWAAKEKTKGRAKRAVKLLVRFWVAHGGRLPQEAWDMVGEAYRPDCEIPRANAKRFFMKTPEGQDMLATELAALLDKVGLTKEKGVQNMMETREKALAGKDFKVARDIDLKVLELLQVKEEEASAAAHGIAVYEEADYDMLDGDDLAGLLDEATVDDEADDQHLLSE